TYTIMAQTAADTLGLPIARVRAELGDSTMPPAPVSGGSQTTASIQPAVQAACKALIGKAAALAAQRPLDPRSACRCRSRRRQEALFDAQLRRAFRRGFGRSRSRRDPAAPL